MKLANICPSCGSVSSSVMGGQSPCRNPYHKGFPRMPSDSGPYAVILLMLALFAPAAFAQITITPIVPEYNYQVLPGSTRQIAVNVANGIASPCGPSTSPSCTGTVSWSVSATTGGASATFTDPSHTAVSSITGGLATMQVNIGATAGNCSISGSIGSYAVSSTATVTVRATSTDSGTPSTTILFNVCAKTTSVIVSPAYRQAYKNQLVSLQSWISGDTNEAVTWAIEAGPVGGNGTLSDTGNRDTVFNAGTVTGRYTIGATSVSNGAAVGTTIVYVSPNALPSYAATSNGAAPRECYHDPAFNTVYDVGSGYTYANLAAVPVSTGWGVGTWVIVHNTGGATPSVYTNYITIANSGNLTNPSGVCGVDDSHTGHLPIMDATNATTQSAAGLYGFGVVTLWPTSHFGYYQGGSVGPSYISVTGLHLRYANPGKNFVPPGGSAPCPPSYSTVASSCQWIDGAAGVYVGSGQYIDVEGNELESNSNGVFTATNASNNGWSTLTLGVAVVGNDISGSGWSNEGQEHQIYFQSWYGLIEGNYINHYLSTAEGFPIKDRGLETISRYNYLQSDSASAGPPRLIDHVERQDSGVYMNFEDYLSYAGQTNCNYSLWCLTDTAGANIIAGYEESGQKTFDYGNVMTNNNQNAEYQIHFAEDHDGGMEAQNGTLYHFNNTIDNCQIMFDTLSTGGYQMYLQQRVLAQNNICYNNAFQRISFNSIEPLIFTGITNLTVPATSITTPICSPGTSCSYNAGTAPGWMNGCDNGVCRWPLSAPLNTHIYSLTGGNYPTTSTYPYNSSTLIPGSGSPAIGAGTALSGLLAQMPVRYQFNVATLTLTPRLFPLTLGSQDQSGGTPTVATPTFSPGAGTYGSTQTVTVSTSTGGATLCITTDGSTPTAMTPGTCSHGTSTPNPVTVASSLTLNAIGTEAAFTNSAVGTAAYVINSAAATPTYAPPAGTYGSAQTVTLSSASGCSGFIAWNTTNAQSGGNLTGVSTTNPLTVSASEAVFAQVQSCPGFTNSPIASATYVITSAAATPTFSPVGGTYASPQTVTISTTTGSPTIYYTTDGSTPTTGSTVYSGPITVTFSETVKAIATAAGFAQSAVGTAVYTINGAAATPTFSPVAGTYGPSQTVTLATSTGGCTGSLVWNTTNAQSGGNLTGTSTTNPLSVATSETVYAQVQSCATWLNSPISSAAYVINGPVTNPTCTPPPTTYTSVQSVTCSSATGGSTTVCTIDGSTPTHGSPVCSGITVAATLTLKALSFEALFTDSGVVSNNYTINLPAATVLILGNATMSGGAKVGGP
jgi:hypothetical protein